MAFPNYPGAEHWGVRVGKASYREGTDIDSLVLHAMAGSYEGSMRWANDSPNNSFHYGVSQDGRVGQAVDEDYAAWHAGNWDMNKRSIGIEHEDLQQAITNPNWFGSRMFSVSTKLAAHLCRKYKIPVSRIYLHKAVSLTGTQCPGNYLPLERYKKEVTRLLGGGTTTPTTLTPVYPEISRWEFTNRPITKLDKGFTLTYENKPFGIFYPAKEVETVGLKRFSRYQFSKALFPSGIPTSKVALTYSGKVFGVFNPKVLYKGGGELKPLVPAPSASTRKWDAVTLNVAREIEKVFPVACSTYPGHGTTGEAKGIDAWVAPLGTMANAEQERLGDRIYDWVLANWSRLGISYMIWWNWYIDDTVQMSYDKIPWSGGSQNKNDKEHRNHVHLQVR